MKTAVIEVRHLCKHFGQVSALNDVSITLSAGEIWGLLGHNGAGKTTLMKHLLGLLLPTRGEIRVLGHSPTGPESRTLRNQIGYLPERVVFYPELTGLETLSYFAQLKGVNLKQCGQLLNEVDLASATHRRVKTYSNGMRQRLGLAQALLGQPRLLLLDEPTAGLDPIATQRFYRSVERLAEQGVTVLLSSHVLPGIEQHINRVAILGTGSLLAAGTLEDLSTASQLPIIVRLRTTGTATFKLDPNDLTAILVRKINDREFEIKIPQESKLTTLRTIMARSDITDISVLPPTLDTIYESYYACAEPRVSLHTVASQQ